MPLAQLGIRAGRVLLRRRGQALGEHVSRSAKIDSSPVFVRRSSPSTPMMSPRSKHCASCQSSPTCCWPMNSWIWPVMSRMSMNCSLPLSRCSTMRPAARTCGPVISPGPCSASHLRKSKSAPAAVEIGQPRLRGRPACDTRFRQPAHECPRSAHDHRTASPTGRGPTRQSAAICRGATIPNPRRWAGWPVVSVTVELIRKADEGSEHRDGASRNPCGRNILVASDSGSMSGRRASLRERHCGLATALAGSAPPHGYAPAPCCLLARSATRDVRCG